MGNVQELPEFLDFPVNLTASPIRNVGRAGRFSTEFHQSASRFQGLKAADSIIRQSVGYPQPAQDLRRCATQSANNLTPSFSTSTCYLVPTD
jgi:hypothetical protein